MNKYYKHFNDGIYKYICDATLEWCPDDPNAHVIIYKGEDGRRWVRPRNEFFGYTKNGIRRFKKLNIIFTYYYFFYRIFFKLFLFKR